MLSKASVLAALGGLSVLAASGVAAQAQCVNCSYSTYYQPYTVRNCERWVPHQVLQPVVTNQIVPVVTYQTVQRTHYVPRTYYTRQITSEPVSYWGGGYGYGGGVIAAGLGYGAGYGVGRYAGYGRYGAWGGYDGYGRGAWGHSTWVHRSWGDRAWRGGGAWGRGVHVRYGGGGYAHTRPYGGFHERW